MIITLPEDIAARVGSPTAEVREDERWGFPALYLNGERVQCLTPDETDRVLAAAPNGLDSTALIDAADDRNETARRERASRYRRPAYHISRFRRMA